MKYYIHLLFFSVLLLSVFACNNSAADSTSASDSTETISPVTVTHATTTSLQETVEVNAVSSYLLKTFVKANTVGYLQSVNVHLGQFVTKGQTLFVIKTKEAEALGNTINNIDTSLHFAGTTRLTSTGSGYITQLTYTTGNYVQDGEQLAEITDTKSFTFILDLPYELKPYLSLNHTVTLRLPDSTVLNGEVQSALPMVDSIAQTQRYIIKVNTGKLIPENLLAKVSLIKKVRPQATVLPKEAILSNEEQTEFWVMKMIDDSTAVKLPVQKGIEKNNTVEIVSPHLSDSVRILLTGNYGLEDTARVQIQQAKAE